MIATHTQESEFRFPEPTKKLDVLGPHVLSQFTVKQTPELAGSESSDFSERVCFREWIRELRDSSCQFRGSTHPHIHTDTYMWPHGNRYACMHHTYTCVINYYCIMIEFWIYYMVLKNNFSYLRQHWCNSKIVCKIQQSRHMYVGLLY